MRKQIQFLLLLLASSFLISTTLFWIAEQGYNTFDGYADVAWWWFVTSSTVGYGDMVPHTILGRIAGVIAIIIGLFGYTYIIGIILQVVQYKFEEKERGYGSVKHENHVVICEYTAFADELIQEIKKNNLFDDRKLVIIGSLVERTPFPEYDFIYGVPISPQIQHRANISNADLIFVFANIRFSDPDTKTLHVVSRVMQNNDHAELYVEMENENHPLLEELPRQVTVMKSDDLLHNALQHKHLNIDRYLSDTTHSGQK